MDFLRQKVRFGGSAAVLSLFCRHGGDDGVIKALVDLQ